MNIFGVGGWEFALIIIIALIVLGPERLVKYAYQIGRSLRKMTVIYREAADTLKAQLEQEMPLEELKQVAEDVQEFRRAATEIRKSFTQAGKTLSGTLADIDVDLNAPEEPAIHPPQFAQLREESEANQPPPLRGWSNPKRSQTSRVERAEQTPQKEQASSAPTFVGWSTPEPSEARRKKRTRTTQTDSQAAGKPPKNGKASDAGG